MKKKLEDAYAFRSDLTDSLIQHLVGPDDGIEEVIDEDPLSHYSIGILYPKSTDPVEQLFTVVDVAVEPNEDEDDDRSLSLANSQFPSTMGMSFSVNKIRGGEIIVDVSSAAYVKTDSAWVRQRIDVDSLNIQVSEEKDSRFIINDDGEWIEISQSDEQENKGLLLRVIVRKANLLKQVPITIALVNTNNEIMDRQRRGEAAFFQSEIRVMADETSGVSFQSRNRVPTQQSGNEILGTRLLYRHAENFATGHGCSVTWPNQADRFSIATTYVPIYDMRLSDSNSDIEALALDMRGWEKHSKFAVIESLVELIDGYQVWVEGLKNELNLLDPDLFEVAKSNIENCSRTILRMRRGVQILSDESDIRPYTAFVLMNSAMVEQRVRSERILAGRVDLDPGSIPAMWRPFQLAFILQCMAGIFDPIDEDRDIADLLWFPTGGGKTEAYLGLIALTLFHRRLCSRSHGVSAIMRYTLRLLTTQQFERAALLMCCCEHIRRKRNDLGNVPFEVGLYIGRAGSPLNTTDAAKAQRLLLSNPDADVSRYGNPLQVKICVWCGAKLTAENLRIESQCVAYCPNEQCEFLDGLPWWVVDDDIYSRRPSLIIGTVDKFAGLAFREEAVSIFNRLIDQDPGIDLIIQDELHLISGPLGTLAGLYETAIDSLGERAVEGADRLIRPKVIASTATIRRAIEQVQSVFDRPVCQFPPPGIDARDTYFSIESSPEVRGSRRYVGLLSPGLSFSTLAIRAMSLLFHKVESGNWSDETRDTYWTLLSYYNSMRVLGSAVLQIRDDVSDRLEYLRESTSPANRNPDDHLIELTSRASATDIPQYLRQLRLQYPDKEAIDVVLATNMISVGMDIDRLGLMVVNGQPFGTAEYIQATSRVGRRDPGLVVVLYNAAKSRDRSHYESFLSYHSTIYSQVEATSVTPFSARARDRALHAVIIILIRSMIPEMRPNAAACKISDYLSEINQIREILVRRVSSIDPNETTSLEAEFDSFIDRWLSEANLDPDLMYSKYGAKTGVLITDEIQDDLHGPISTLRSMRDVDETCGLFEIKIDSRKKV